MCVSTGMFIAESVAWPMICMKLATVFSTGMLITVALVFVRNCMRPVEVSAGKL